MPLTLPEVLDHLKEGTFEALIGEYESPWLECKVQPYDLAREDQKLELAKDVSGLANGSGGLLLIGFATSKNDLHSEDTISGIRPFPIARFDITQYRQVLATWLYPCPDGLTIEQYNRGNIDSSLVVIYVPQVKGIESPVLVAKSMLNEKRKSEIVFGYCVRKQAGVDHHDVRKIHTLIRDGNRLDSDIRENFASLHSAIAELRDQSINIADGPTVEEVQAAIRKAQLAVGLVSAPNMVLAACPTRSMNIRSIFETRDSEIVKFIDHPPEIRFSGFDLNSGGNSKIIEGKLRRSVSNGFKLIEVHRNGIVIFVCNAGADGLSWGRPQRQVDSYLINQVALVESVYLFMIMLDRTYDSFLSVGDIIQLELHFKNMTYNHNKFRLESGPANAFQIFQEENMAPHSSGILPCQIKYKEFLPERNAYLLLLEVYAWFGFEEDKIPYVKNTENGKVIDIDEFLKMR